MVIFLDKLELCQYIPQRPNVIFNLSSMYSGFKDATGLFTNMKIVNYTTIPMYEYVNTVEFDMQYYNAIFNNDTMFAIFMDIIYAVRRIIIILYHLVAVEMIGILSVLLYVIKRFIRCIIQIDKVFAVCRQYGDPQ